MNGRMSRAGRCKAMKSVLMKEWRRDPNKRFTIGRIANKMGLKSSTKLKAWLVSYASFDEEIEVTGDDTITRFKFTPYVQKSFERREITINGSRHVVADWIKDFVAGVQ